ncbi:SMI1/KNR4 family protein [Rhodanobacter thiooxydans]|uniref:SMI1/KNR4 family protein n=1 Tax=Rhodanobacter thiooxydans TaxID=416169 RepID=UPI000A7E2195|nr:SMI1/KNR4 family protein [Rhodanobacter thiooxydans]MCW0203596.1 SMI1/KNR4 family protein [Rhodanobacter thiooxydans]
MSNLGQNFLKLIDLGSPGLGVEDVVIAAHLRELAGTLAEELVEVLRKKNGTYIFHSALHIFPAQTSSNSVGLDEWNDNKGWRSEYGDLADGCLFFSEDLFGSQFCIKSNAIWSFDPETAEMQFIGKNFDAWAKEVLDDYRVLTGQPLALAWQQSHGALPAGKRLVPKVPFVCGGAFELSNLILMDAERGMRLRGQLASQIRDLPDGTKIRFVIE